MAETKELSSSLLSSDKILPQGTLFVLKMQVKNIDESLSQFCFL